MNTLKPTHSQNGGLRVISKTVLFGHSVVVAKTAERSGGGKGSIVLSQVFMGPSITKKNEICFLLEQSILCSIFRVKVYLYTKIVLKIHKRGLRFVISYLKFRFGTEKRTFLFFSFPLVKQTELFIIPCRTTLKRSGDPFKCRFADSCLSRVPGGHARHARAAYVSALPNPLAPILSSVLDGRSIRTYTRM